jgi:hypothetical protein
MNLSEGGETMPSGKNLPRILEICLLCLLIPLPASIAAQETGGEQANLSLQDVKQGLKQCQQSLKEAEGKLKGGNSSGVEAVLGNYTRGMEQINAAMRESRFDGSMDDRTEAYDEIVRATGRDRRTLSKMLKKVEESARPAVEQALNAAQSGNQAAQQYLKTAQRTGRGSGRWARQSSGGVY